MDEFTLLTREEIIRRLARLKGEKYVHRPDDITLHDLSKWMGVSRRCVRGHCDGAFPISEAHQIGYSAFFSMLDAKCLAIQHVGRIKTLVRVKPPKELPKREIRPFIDFTNMRLKVE